MNVVISLYDTSRMNVVISLHDTTRISVMTGPINGVILQRCQEWHAIVHNLSKKHQEDHDEREERQDIVHDCSKERRDGHQTSPSFIKKIGKRLRSNSKIRTDPSLIAKIRRRSRSYQDNKTLKEQ